MNKQAAENFLKSNPKIKLTCDNPECNHENTFDSQVALQNDIFTYECEKCHFINHENLSNFIDEIDRQMKLFGF